MNANMRSCIKSFVVDMMTYGYAESTSNGDAYDTDAHNVFTPFRAYCARKAVQIFTR